MLDMRKEKTKEIEINVTFSRYISKNSTIDNTENVYKNQLNIENINKNK